MSTTLALVAAGALVVALPLAVFALVPVGGFSRPARRPVGPAATAAPSTPRDELPGVLRLVAPGESAERLERTLALAGLLGRWPLARVLQVKAILLLAAIVLSVVVLAAGGSPLRLLLVPALLGFAWLAPQLVLDSRARERQSRIQHELPDALDQIQISLEAGLGLESAVARAGQFGDGPLAEELARTVQDMRVGFSRREAYLALAQRTDVSDLKRFARAIMQADAYGVSVGGVVRSQAKELRSKRRHRAEERAMKVPVQVLFPLMLCILPVLFVVVLAPAALNLIATLGL